MNTYYLGQSSHLLLFIFFKLAFFYFIRILIKFSLNSLLLLQFPMNSFESRYTYSLGQSSYLLLLRFLNFLFYFLANFHPIFIQIATAPTIFNVVVSPTIPLKLGTEIRYWLADFEIICGFF